MFNIKARNTVIMACHIHLSSNWYNSKALRGDYIFIITNKK